MSITKEEENRIIDALMLADETEDIADATLQYERCLQLIPEPLYDSVYAIQVFMSLGELYFLNADYNKALEYYSEAIKCSGALGTPTIHLRLGQIRFELGDLRRAEDELMRAYMAGDKAVFEFEDPKYYKLIKDIAERTC